MGDTIIPMCVPMNSEPMCGQHLQVGGVKIFVKGARVVNNEATSVFVGPSWPGY